MNIYGFCKLGFISFISFLEISAVINSIGIAAFNVFSQNSVVAQVVPDKTLGTERSLINPNFDIDINGIPSTLIEGGAIRGTNLFHSFKKFNVGEGRGVYFNNPDGIQRILSRVTGNDISKILGTLGVLGNADLFLINPNGIVFGPNASLDLKGSFLATTAESIVFANGYEFSATNHQAPPLLTVDVPIGLQFREPIGDIIQQPTSLLSIITGTGIQVQPGKTLAFVGGNITVRGGSIFVPGVQIELGSVAGNGYVSLHPIEEGWALSYEGVQNFQDIQIIQGSLLFVGNGDIQVQGRHLLIKDGSQILGTEGTMKVVASETVEITGFSLSDDNTVIFSGLANEAISDKDAGSITINTRRLIIQDGGRISTKSTGLLDGEINTIATGKGGNLMVNASESVELTSKSGALTGLFSGTESFGDGGNITINTEKLTIRDGAKISAETTGISSFDQPIATGKGGDISIIAPKSVNVNSGFLSVEATAAGTAGNLMVETGQINVSDGAKVSVNSQEGQAGNLKITANSLTLNRGSITAETGKSGAEGANITLQLSDLLQLENESLISATANGDANGGNININSPLLVAFPPTGSNGSDIIANAVRGNGGNININSQGIFGIAERPAIPGDQTNDIDASSEFGATGQVQINSTIDPNRGIIQLPETVVDPNTLIAQNPCKKGTESQFTRTGRGGLPPNPAETLNPDITQVGLIEPLPSNQTQTPTPNVSAPPPDAILPAQGWIFNERGEVVLVAYNPSITESQRPKANLAGCPAP